MTKLVESRSNPHLSALKSICDEIAHAKPSDTQTIFGDLEKMAMLYYDEARRQAKESFYAAQIAAAAGVAFFGYAIYQFIHNGSTQHLLIGGVPGLIVQVISGLNFSMYRKAIRQFELFHICLERMGRYLLANSVSENIVSQNTRDEARLELMKTMSQAPMLPVEGVEKPSNAKQKTRGIQVAQKKAAAA